MAFSQQEQKIYDWGLQNGKSRQEVESAISKLRSGFVPAQQPVVEKGLLQKTKERGVGVVKEVAETAVETASLLQTGGQASIAAVDPTRTFAEVKEETGFPSLQGEQLEGVRETLEAKTPEERQGKILAFGIELLAPVAKPGIGLVSKGLSKAKDALTTGTRGIEEIGTKGRSAFDDIQDVVSRGVIKAEDALNPIDAGVETVLRRTEPQTFNGYVEATRKAVTEPKAPTALEIAGNKAEGALDTIQRKLKEFGGQKSTLLNQASIGNKPVGSIVVKYRQALLKMADSKTLDATDKRILNEIATEAEKLGNNPQAKEVDKFIDFVQDKLFTSKRSLSIDVTDPTIAQLRGATGELNEALKSQLPDAYRNVNASFSDLVGLRNELNAKLGKEGERAGALMKRVFSPADARTKEMFQEVLDATGVDLVDEAVIARYTMDVFGDARQRNLLQSILELQPTSLTKQAVDKGLDLILGKFKGTEAELRKALRIVAGEGS